MGRPGKPAPEPTSINCGTLAAGRWLLGSAHLVRAEGKRWRAANKDSPKWRVTTWSGWRTAVRLMRAFQRRSISMYVDICPSWEGVRTADSSGLKPARNDKSSRAVDGPDGVRKGLRSSAMRAGSIRPADCRWRIADLRAAEARQCRKTLVIIYLSGPAPGYL